MLKRFETFILSITQIYRYIQKIKDQEMMELGLKGTHAMCLFTLNHYPDGLTSGELAALCYEDKAAISRATSLLRKKELVYIDTADTQKRYRAKLKLTPSGQKIAEKMISLIEYTVMQGGAGLSKSERDIFYLALNKIANNLQNLCHAKGE